MRRVYLLMIIALSARASNIEEVLITKIADAQLPLSEKCGQQFTEYVANLVDLNGEMWALQMLDATSKIPSGLMSLNFGEMGDFLQCVNTKTTNTSSGQILGKYCLGFLSVNDGTQTPVSKAQFLVAKAGSLGLITEVGQSGRVPGPVWGMCVPDGCSTDDVNVLGNYVFNSLVGDLITVSFTDILCQTIDDVHQKLSAGAITTICLISLLFLLVLGSTVYDIYCVFHTEKTPPLIIKGFSAYSNGKKIFKMTAAVPDQLPCLNGLKCISMVWVVAGHQYSVSMVAPITNTKHLIEWAEALHSMFLISGTLSVDTFLTIGGALMSYGYMKAKHKKIPFNIFMYYLHRYLRLTAPFALVVLVSSTLLKYMGSGPKWPFVDLYFQQNCVDYWWSALLYVQNYVNVSHMCLGQTWYLSIDMQLYIISPLVFYALWRYPKTCLLVLTLAVLGFIGGSFYVAWQNNLTAILSNFYGNSDAYNNKYYLLTHTRAAPWVIGVILGYYIFKIKQNEVTFRPYKILVLVAWGLCVATLFLCVLGGHSTLRSSDYDRFGNSFYVALVRPAWSFAIAWIILACTSGFGGPINWFLSLPIYQVLNRFTYSIYLTHVTMLYMISYDKKWPIEFSDFNMTYEFWGTLWFSTGLAVLLVFTTESPMIVIEKIIFGSLGKKKQKPVEKDAEKGVDNAAFDK